MLNDDMNYFKLLQQLKKIKVTLGLIVGTDPQLLDSVKKLYREISTVYQDDYEEKQFQQSKNDFMKFIDRDEI